MKITITGKIVSSGKGISGLFAAWASMADVFTVELPKLLAALARIVTG